MIEAIAVCERESTPRSRKTRPASRHLRREVDNMLRDVAFVLAQTRRVREAILTEQNDKRLANS